MLFDEVEDDDDDDDDDDEKKCYIRSVLKLDLR